MVFSTIVNYSSDITDATPPFIIIQTLISTIMSKLLVVFGATGQQGGSVVDFVLNDAELSKQYSIRAITRDPTSTSSQSLKQKNVEVMKADLDDINSVHEAMRGAHTVFILGAPSFGPDAKAKELSQGIAAADAAVAANVQYYIFSTLPHVERTSGGKYTKVAGFDSKAETEDYIRTLPMKSAFFAPGSFMQNWNGIMKPVPNPDGSGYNITRAASPSTKLPLIDTAGDTGKYVGAILANPDKYEGKTFCAASGLYSLEEIAKAISKSTGKDVVYKQKPAEELLKTLPPWGAMLIEMMLYQQDYGYYGQDTAEKVKWAVDNARGKVTTLEEYLGANPIKL